VDDRPHDPNVSDVAIGPEPYGQAALLLVESLIHGLIARSSLTVEQAVEIVQIAAEVTKDTAAELDDTPATRKSIHLLDSICVSLMHDLPRS
jgi:hypothetical protein